MFDVVIIGAGPAGIGLLSAMHRRLEADSLISLKLCLIERQDVEASGCLADYNIPSDTQAEKFLTCLDDLPVRITEDPSLRALTDTLKSYGSNAVPLPIAGAFYRVLGARLCADMVERKQLTIMTQTLVVSASWQGSDWHVVTVSHGVSQCVKTNNLVLACGATEPLIRLDNVLRAYNLQSEDLKARCLSSDILRAKPGDLRVQSLSGLKRPTVTVVGGSHSAISTAGKLLSLDIPFKEKSITILHRSPMRVTFDSAQAARNLGFFDFSDDDICPKTKRVFALKGFRLDSRDLLMAINGYGGGQVEDRIALKIGTDATRSEIRAILESADLVVSALGYRPAYVPLYNGNSEPEIALNSPHYVDSQSRLVGSNRRPIPNCYALGLASNYNLAGRFGEVSFAGQANGLVLWHKDIGMEIASTLLGE